MCSEVTKVVTESWLIRLPYLGLVWLTGDRRMPASDFERSVERVLRSELNDLANHSPNSLPIIQVWYSISS